MVVVSHALWQQRFNGDPTILDRPLRLNNREFAVVGVAEEGFQGSTMVGTDLWAPMAMLQSCAARQIRRCSPRSTACGTSRLAASSLASPWRRRKQTQHPQRQLQEGTAHAAQHHTIKLMSMGRIPARSGCRSWRSSVSLRHDRALLAIACSNVAGMLLLAPPHDGVKWRRGSPLAPDAAS